MFTFAETDSYLMPGQNFVNKIYNKCNPHEQDYSEEYDADYIVGCINYFFAFHKIAFERTRRKIQRSGKSTKQ